MEIEERFEHLKAILKASFAEIAENIGVTSQALGRVANGKNLPSFKIISGLVREYPINPHWLLLGEGSPLLDSRATGNQKAEPVLDPNYVKLSTEIAELRKMVEEMKTKQNK